MISKRYIYHLVRVKDSKSETRNFEPVPVVNEFLEVFSEDFPRVSAKIEIVSVIDILPDTQPIFTPPYILSLTELKKHSKDLQHKGLIRPISLHRELQCYS